MLKKLLSADGFGNYHSNNYDYLNAHKIAKFDLNQSLQSITSNGLYDLRYEIARFFTGRIFRVIDTNVSKIR